MGSKVLWKYGLGAVAVAIVAIGAVTVAKPAGASPTITVYKTPT